MKELVEHVTSAITPRLYDRMDEYAIRAVARIAVEAALRHLRDNPSKQMIEDGNWMIDDCIDSWDYDSGSGYCVEQRAAAETFRAMISKAMEEMEQTQ